MSSPPTPSVYVPFLPDIDPYVLPNDNFDAIINKYGIRLFWLKSHTCPCIYGGPIPGSPDPACLNCQGRGIYWDNPTGPFMGLITWTDFSPRPDESGAKMNTVQGLVQQGQPTLSIPFNSALQAGSPFSPGFSQGFGPLTAFSNQIWAEASIYDMFVEVDAVTRYNAQLQVGVRTALPYQQNVTVAPSGAVTIYNQQTSTITSVSGYIVSGVSVFLPFVSGSPFSSGFGPGFGGGISVYPQGTNYVVEFTASPAYVALRPAGAAPHTRPFGQVKLPRRFKIQSLDLWTRARYAGEIPIGVLG